MKRLSAILLSLLLMWMQVVVMARPATADAPIKCTCCSCKTARCCVGESDSSASQPQPVAPVQSAQLNFNLLPSAASPAWFLPSGEADVFSAASALPLSAARIPLFTRDCAILI